MKKLISFAIIIYLGVIALNNNITFTNTIPIAIDVKNISEIRIEDMKESRTREITNIEDIANLVTYFKSLKGERIQEFCTEFNEKFIIEINI
jgi:hypothetical protein